MTAATVKAAASENALREVRTTHRRSIAHGAAENRRHRSDDGGKPWLRKWHSTAGAAPAGATRFRCSTSCARNCHPEVLERFMLLALDPIALTLLVRVGREWRATVMSFGLPGARFAEGLRMKVSAFCGSIELLVWAIADGSSWTESTCDSAAAGGHVEVRR